MGSGPRVRSPAEIAAMRARARRRELELLAWIDGIRAAEAEELIDDEDSRLAEAELDALRESLVAPPEPPEPVEHLDAGPMTVLDGVALDARLAALCRRMGLRWPPTGRRRAAVPRDQPPPPVEAEPGELTREPFFDDEGDSYLTDEDVAAGYGRRLH